MLSVGKVSDIIRYHTTCNAPKLNCSRSEDDSFLPGSFKHKVYWSDLADLVSSLHDAQ